jgi:hypothetical protein
MKGLLGQGLLSGNKLYTVPQIPQLFKSDLSLYNSGDEQVTFTGGWVSSYTFNGGTFTKNASTFQLNNPIYSDACGVTNNLVDLTDVSKIKMTFTFNLGSSYGWIGLSVSADKTGVMTNDTVKVQVSTGGTQTAELDVSSLSGSYYIKLSTECFHTATAPLSATINKIWIVYENNGLTKSDLVLYNAGDEQITFSGGWAQLYKDSGVVGTITKNASNISINKASSSIWGGIAIGAANSIDLTNISSLYIDWEIVGTGGVGRFGANPSSPIAGASQYSNKELNVIPTARTISKLDVSSLTGKCYISVSAVADMQQVVTVNIYKIWCVYKCAITGTATPADVLAGKTFSGEAGIGLTGTMIAGKKFASGTAPDMYQNGTQSISNLLFNPSNVVVWFAINGSNPRLSFATFFDYYNALRCTYDSADCNIEINSISGNSFSLRYWGSSQTAQNIHWLAIE